MVRAAVWLSIAWCGLALAGAPPPAGSCRCADARRAVAAHRKELARLQKQLDNDPALDAAPDEDYMEKQIADLHCLSLCASSPKRLRSQAAQLQSGMEGLVASYYDHWGMKKGEDGRRSFRALREATKLDPNNQTAWASYGRALMAIHEKVLKARIAKFLGIDLDQELSSATANLHRLSLTSAGLTDPSRAVLSDLTKIKP